MTKLIKWLESQIELYEKEIEISEFESAKDYFYTLGIIEGLHKALYKISYKEAIKKDQKVKKILKKMRGSKCVL